ncbi:MAG: NHL repeat-containing protein [candidate division KSB1 bacterium]|nr:NHL repeat-containing protein [candidate division KSB1 bacterium]MDZ7365602.1 NHL repeat-containing protein [candidate division KSB1 bacterium]MDZ7403322.1 NHL repeat-containing protein [candidate division KSB1 bacterium]
MGINFVFGQGRVVRHVIIILSLQFPAFAAAQSQPQIVFRGIMLDEVIGTARLSQPLGMDIDPDGNIYLADTGNNRILKFNRRGELRREAGGFGFDKQQFDRPVDIWAGNGLEVFVVDYNNQRLERYDKDLNYIASYYSDEVQPAPLQFGYPAAVGFSANGEIFLADHEFNRVLRIDSFGKPKSSFGDFNWGEGRLARPAKILLAARQKIFVSDSTAEAIVEFDDYGNFVRRLGEGVLRDPAGMAMLGANRRGQKSEGLLLAADRGNHRIVCFGNDGEKIFDFGRRGRAPGEFSFPADVAVQGNRIFVLDTGNNRLQVFELQSK